MPRGKACASLSVKEVIGALCKLLAAAGLDSVPAPEAFRRAKFGGEPEEDLFWKLLSDVLLTACVVSSDADLKLNAERRKLVTAGLWQSGYHAAWMYDGRGGGGGGGEDGVSSQDLLLALGWLLAAGTLELLVMQRVKGLDPTLLTCRIQVSPNFPSELPVAPASLRRLQWLTGSLRHQGRSLLSSLHERTRAIHKVLSHSESSGAAAPSDQSSAGLKEACAPIQLLCDLLQAFVKWKQVEDVFWSWMDSVMDSTPTRPAADSLSCLSSHSPRHCHHGNQQLKNLEALLQKLPSSQGRRDAASRGVCGQRAALCAAVLSSFPGSAPTYQARFLPDTSVGLTGAAAVAEGRKSGRGLKASHAIHVLRHTEAALLGRRTEQRLLNRARLQEAIGRRDDLVLIPP